MELITLEDLLKLELQEIYSAEKQTLGIWPKIVETATSGDLKEELRGHVKETKEHINRLDDIGRELSITLDERECIGIKGLIEETKETLELDAEPMVKDAAIIVAVQIIEHYEIAMYGSLIAHADAAGLQQIGDILEKTLEEESETDDALSDLAEATINPEAED